MAQYRQDKINDRLTEEMAEILREIKDPRISSVFISVTGAECTPDFKYAKIYYSVLGNHDPDEVVAGLKSATGFIRRELAKRVNLRVTPELRFIYDESLKRGDEINRLFKSIEEKEEPDSNN
ncbi:MAG: 30S ribosome-binding factor RbfA [Eubacteriales bacterium]|jgi:ribosome-binding factor A|nr:30S ribosome-binding factor RbfA [Clostridiales bacterium]